jgi:hypothetical protein
LQAINHNKHSKKSGSVLKHYDVILLIP